MDLVNIPIQETKEAERSINTVEKTVVATDENGPKTDGTSDPRTIEDGSLSTPPIVESSEVNQGEKRPSEQSSEPSVPNTSCASPSPQQSTREPANASPVPITPSRPPSPTLSAIFRSLTAANDLYDGNEPRARRVARIRRRLTSPIRRLAFALGHRNPPRQRIVWFLFREVISFIEFVVVIVLLCLARYKYKSPKDREISQWDAAGTPLPALCIVWLIRVTIGMGMLLWDYKWTTVRLRHRDAEAAARSNNNGRVNNALRDRPLHTPPPRSPSPTSPNSNAIQPAIADTNNTTPPQSQSQSRPGAADEESMILDPAYNKMVKWEPFHRRLTTLSSLLTLAHFVLTSIFLYSSVSTHRLSAPLIWWLSFAILCIGYLVVLEFLFIFVVFFVVVPILFLLINAVFMCIGRAPLTAQDIAGAMPISPEIPKLPQKIVDRIPLVLYIPRHPTSSTTNVEGTEEVEMAVLEGPINRTEASLPSGSTSATPQPASPKPKSKQLRFAFLRWNSSNTKASTSSSIPRSPLSQSPQSGGVEKWENKWGKSPLPLVKLEGNRATCAICLMDFEEPPKRGEEGSAEPPVPLRLLGCGHVFHKSCLDPWLVDVSGRCPTCQKKVEIEVLAPELMAKPGPSSREHPRERERDRRG